MRSKKGGCLCRDFLICKLCLPEELSRWKIDERIVIAFPVVSRVVEVVGDRCKPVWV